MPRINNIQLRRGTYSEWDAKSSEVLASGEPGFDITNNVLKIGDGSTNWKNLKPIQNIDTSGSTDNQYLRYDSSSNKWTPTSSGIFSNLIVENPSQNTHTLSFLSPQSSNPVGANISSIIVADGAADRSVSLKFEASTNGLLKTAMSINDGCVSIGKASIMPDGETSLMVYGDIVLNKGLSGPAWTDKPYNKDDVVEYNNNLYISLISFDDNQAVNPQEWIDSYTNPPNPPEGFTPVYRWQLIDPSFLRDSHIDGIVINSGISHMGGLIVDQNDIVVNNHSLIVNSGIINVNNSFGNDYNMIINSSGISISKTVELVEILDVFIGQPVPPALITNEWAPDHIKGLTDGKLLQTGDTVLITNVSDSIYNGFYEIVNGIATNTIKFQRLAPYTNSYVLNNRTIFGVRSVGSTYILNPDLVGDSVTIGTDPLAFKLYDGDPVITFNASKDAEFAGGVYAPAKYFRIKHPDPDSSYEYLQYGSLESPYHGVRLTGESELKKGLATIPLPKYLKHLIHKTDINIQLTNKGHHKILYVDSVNLDKDHFVIKGYRSKTGGPFPFFWCFTGVRKDVDPLIPEY